MPDNKTEMTTYEGEVVNSNKGNNSSMDVTPYLFSINKVEKSNCVMCNSKYRQYAEDMFDAQTKKNYSAIQQKLQQEFDFKVSRQALKNHLIRHHKVVEDNVALQDYAEEIQQWVGQQHNRMASLRSRLAVLEREYFTIANSSDDLDIQERRKNAEVLKKLSETMMVYENKISECDEAAAPVNVLFHQLTIIINDELRSVDSATARKLVSRVLERLKENCGDMLTE